MRHVPGVSSVTLQQAVSGTYQTEQISATEDLTNGTEYEVATVATNILASTANQDEVFTWVKCHIYTFDTAQDIVGEWFLLRCLIADATQDMDNEADCEALQKDGRILKRGWVRSAHGTYGGAKIEFEVHKVKLRYGEELRLLYLPYRCGAAQVFIGRLEWRQQGK